MSEADRVAIHEAMEQQTVTIAKAGIHASLNARCSVLAAANPVYGQYDRKRRIQDNIGLPDSLLSRFDLLFVVLDQLDPDTDRRIASHVIKGHRYKPDHGRSGHDSDDDDESDIEREEPDSRKHSIWQKSRYDSTHNGNNSKPNSEEILQHDFLRKYLHYAKTRIKPVLTEEARECIASRYAEMRSRQDERTLPVTARSLETVIRLASAHAKARLSPIVEAETDVAAAMDILGFALYHENNTAEGDGDRPGTPDLEEQRPSKKMRSADNDSNEESSSSDEDEEQEFESEVQNLRTRIWTELRAADGAKSIEEMCTDVQDRSSVDAVIEQLTKEQKVMSDDDGIVYLLQ